MAAKTAQETCVRQAWAANTRLDRRRCARVWGMPQLTLPEGQSVRQIAARLGVSVAALQQHAGVADVDAPLRTATTVQVPNGFLRRRPDARQWHRNAVGRAPQSAGMNTFLAVDMEHRRTQLAGGMQAQQATSDEQAALAEADRAYERLESDSNDLARRLYTPLTASRARAVRTRAFVGEALAYAQGHVLFGEPAEPARQQAISSAKAALMADPKCAAAHLAMSRALHVDARQHQALDAAFEAIERALELAPDNPVLWGHLALLALTANALEDAQVASEQAIERSRDGAWALYAASLVHLACNAPGEAVGAARRLTELRAGFANARLVLGVAERRLGNSEAGETAYQKALATAQTTPQQQHLQGLWHQLEQGSTPAGGVF